MFSNSRDLLNNQPFDFVRADPTFKHVKRRPLRSNFGHHCSKSIKDQFSTVYFWTFQSVIVIFMASKTQLSSSSLKI